MAMHCRTIKQTFAEVSWSRRVSSIAKPFDKSLNAFLNLGLWIVAEQPTRFRNISKGLRHIARLHRLPIDFGALAERVFHDGNQFAQFNRARLAQIDDFVIALVVIDRRTNAGDYIVDISIIPPRPSIAEYRNWFARGDQFRKLVNRQVGPLACAINGEEAQANDPQVVKMSVAVANQFTRGFRRRVR